MNRLVRVGAAALGGIAAAGTAAGVVAGRRWDHTTASLVGRLDARRDRAAAPPRVHTRDQLAGLPAPVARYLALAIPDGQRLVRRARVRHEGEFASRPGEWSRFTSVQEVAVRPPGFVWAATIRMAPLVAVRVRDSYVAGEGTMFGAVAGLVPVVNQHGTRAMAEASLQRFLAEATWFPTALLPGDAGAGVTWSPVDDSTARATLTDGAVSVSVDFHFDGRGEIARTSTTRYRDVNGTPVRTPWVGHVRDYRRLHGLLVPTDGEVEWVTPEGRLPYWRGRVTGVEYELVP